MKLLGISPSIAQCIVLDLKTKKTSILDCRDNLMDIRSLERSVL